MVQKYQSPVRVYKHPFELVMAAYQKRFPTCDMIPVLIDTSIVTDVESDDKATHTIERRCKLNVNAPYILKRVAGCEFVYFIQKNALNRRERSLKINAYNESFSSRVIVNEFCEYSVHPDNPNWTCFEQSATLEVKSFFGFEGMVEKIAIKQYTANIKRGKEIIQHYLTELESDGVTFVPTWAEENPHLVSDSSTESAAAAADGDDGDEEDVGESEKSRSSSSSQRAVGGETSSSKVASDANLDEDYIEHSLGMLNPIEESTLIQLRMWLSDTHNGKIPRDEHILRFLRSRDFNMEKSRESLCQSLSWRKQHQIDRLLEAYAPGETLQKYFLGGWHHHDIDGRPVYVLKLGQMDTKGVLKAVGEEKILKHILSLMEEGLKRCQDLSAMNNKPMMSDHQIHPHQQHDHQRDNHHDNSTDSAQSLSSWTCIVDLEGLSMRHLWRPGIQALLRFIELIESNYPETMARLLIVRAPRVFPVLWALLNPFIDEKTSSKFMMYTGSDYLKPGGLIDYIPEEFIPEFLGGTCKCKIPNGGFVPKSLYRKEWENRENGELWEDTVYERASLFKGLPHEVIVKVPEKEGVITWDFDSIRGDIVYTLYFTSKENVFVSNDDSDVSKVTCTTTPSTKEGSTSPHNCQVMAKNLILDEDYSIVESGIVCREGESVQGSHVASEAGTYVLQWKWAGLPGSGQSTTVQDVLDQVTHSAKAKLIYYHELLPSQNFKGSMTSLESCQSAFSSLTITSG